MTATPSRPGTIRCALAATLIGLALAGCGGGGDDATSPPPNAPPGGGSPPASTALMLLPQRLSLVVDQQAAVAALNATAAVTWSSSDASVVTVDSAGALTATGRGVAVITATDGTLSSHADVQVYLTSGPGADPTSESLIAQALTAGSITAEQALVYRLEALFNDDQLPLPYRGAPDPSPHSSALREAAAGYDGFSAATQAALRPFLLPPIYAESWFAKQTGIVPPQTAQALARRATAAGPGPCQLQTILEMHATAHFNIWNMPTETSRLEGTYIASVIEDIYKTETELLNRFPLPDTDLPCSGGDGAIDIYVFPIGGMLEGQTIAYPGHCASTPAYIMLNDMLTSAYFVPGGFLDFAEKNRFVKGPLAHELLHTIQFGMARAASCDDYLWIDEATAMSVIDIVDPTLNVEDGLNKRGFPGTRSGSFFVDYLLGGHMVAIENPSDQIALNGYGDYIFFQFLQRKYGNSILKNLFDSWERNGAVASLEVALSASGHPMETAWPAFALALWNDSVHDVQNDLELWDGYDWGMAYIVDLANQAGYNRPIRTMAVDQKGSKRASFDLLGNASVFDGVTSYEVPPRSMFFEHLVFTDASVSSVLIENPVSVAGDGGVRLRLQALVKIGGTWKAAEDWSKDQQKFFCLDKQDERLQELVLIVSNSANVPATQPAKFSSDTPLRISTSNVGCWKWQGSASVHTTSDNGTSNADTTARAVGLTFELSADAEPSASPVFLVTAGTASGNSRTATPFLGCSATLTAAPASVGASDGLLSFDSDLKSWSTPSPDRNVKSLRGLSFLNTSTQTVCPGVNSTNTSVSSWAWLGLPLSLFPVAVADDGRTIQANVTQGDPSGTAQAVHTFTFTALKE